MSEQSCSICGAFCFGGEGNCSNPYVRCEQIREDRAKRAERTSYWVETAGKLGDQLNASESDTEHLTAEVVRLRAERDEAKRDLSEVLAVLCGDGGHYQEKHGTRAAMQHGLATFHDARADVARLSHVRELLEGAYATAVRHRTEAQAAVAQARREGAAEMRGVIAAFLMAELEGDLRSGLVNDVVDLPLPGDR